ncbi:MAG: Branched-chain alpha-keto acid dehydrogenase, E1 component, beta subunit, partial [uncultured Nocardioidaceae bacterium]
DPADARQGAQRGAAPGDGGRPQGARHGRGRRQARRRLPDHRRAAEGLRGGPGHRLAAGGVRDHRDRRGPGDPGLPARLRDPVRRVRLPGVRPDRQPGREAALPQPGQGADADGHPHPVRRRDRGGRAPQRVARGAVRAHPGAQGRRLLQPRRRLLDGAAGHRPRRPGRLPRAEAAVPRRQGGHRRDRHPRPALRLAGGARGDRPDAAGLRADGQDLPGLGGGGGRRGAQRRGDRPAHAVAARHRAGVRVGTPDRARGRGPRGPREPRPGGGARRPDHRGVLLRARGPGAAGRGVRHPVPTGTRRGGVAPRPRPGARRRRPLVRPL